MEREIYIIIELSIGRIKKSNGRNIKEEII